MALTGAPRGPYYKMLTAMELFSGGDEGSNRPDYQTNFGEGPPLTASNILPFYKHNRLPTSLHLPL